MNAVLSQPPEGAWLYLWIDANYLKVCEGGGSSAVR